MPLEDHKQAVKDGLISQKQYDKLPPHLLTAIVKSKKKNTKKGDARKGAVAGSRLAFDDTKQEKRKNKKKK